MAKAGSTEKMVREIRRHTRRRFSAEEKIRIVLEELRGEESIAALCRREGLAPNLYYRWSKEFLEAGKKRLLGDGFVIGLLCQLRPQLDNAPENDGQAL